MWTFAAHAFTRKCVVCLAHEHEMETVVRFQRRMAARAHAPRLVTRSYYEDCRRVLRTLLFTNYTSPSYVELCGELRARVYEL